MELQKIADARARATRQGWWIRLAALPFGLAVGAFAVAVPMFTPRGYEVVAIVGAPLAFLAVFLGVLVLGARHLIRTRAVVLDGAFGFLGPGQQTSVVGRGWAGAIDGRQVNIWFSKGPQLEVYVSATTHARAAVGRDNRLARMAAGALDREPITVNGLMAAGPDAGWVARWLDQPGVREALPILLEEDGRSLRTLSVQPDCVCLITRYLDQFDEPTTRGWLAALDACAAAAEAVGAPGERQLPGVAARLRTSRGTLATFLGIVLGATVFILVLAAAVAATTVFLTE